MGGLGRRIPSDFSHVVKYPLQLTTPPTLVAERIIGHPTQGARRYMNQGQEGACVGFSASWMMTLLNGPLYKPRWLYKQAQLVDEYPDTPPAEGSSVRAGMDILRLKGHVKRMGLRPRLSEGIAANRWATSVDEVRVCINAGIPVTFGINWYTNFDRPYQDVNGEWWIGTLGGNLGTIRGGHAICGRGVSDVRQAVLLTNSWGTAYPDVWVPYTVIARLLDEGGEATVVTDR